MQRRNLLKAITAAAASVALFTSLAAHADDKVIKVGTISGPDAQIWQVVQKVAKREGLNVKVIEFNDYMQPNAALDAGDLDANSFQHQPYLDSQVKQRGYKIVNAGLTYISPLGVYSKKLKSLKDLPQGAKVAVPNDPSNENRALLLLQSQGVIKLKAGAGTNGNNATRARRGGESEEDQARRTRCRATAAHARRRRCRRDQHELRARGGPATDEGCDRARRRA